MQNNKYLVSAFARSDSAGFLTVGTMDWKTLVAAAAILALFIAQGGLLIFQRENAAYARLFGFLTIFVGVLGSVSFFLVGSGNLVLGREFGVAIVQGHWAYVSLILLLMGIPLAAGIGVYVSRLATHSVSPLWLILCAGFAVGASASFRMMRPLNPEDPSALHLYTYDLWWPPLALWVFACLLDCILALCHLRDPWKRVWLHSAIPAGLSIWVAQKQQWGFELDDPRSLVLWKISLLASLPILVGLLGIQLFFPIFLKAKSVSPRRALLRLTLAVGAVYLALLSGRIWWKEPNRLSVLTLWCVFSIGLGLLLFSSAYNSLRAWRSRKSLILDLAAPGQRHELLFLLILGIVAFSLGDLLYLAQFGPFIDLLLLLLPWLLIFKAAASGRLYAAARERTVRGTTPSLIRTYHLVPNWLHKQESPAKHVLGAQPTNELATSSSLSPQPDALPIPALKTNGSASGSLIRKVPVVLLKTVFALGLLVALAQLPNAGRTIIYPFEVHVASTQKDMDKLLAFRLLNSLGRLKKELRADIVTLRSGESGATTSFVSATEGVVSLDTTVSSRSEPLKLGSVEIPLNLLIAPFQPPIRSLLRAREIHGAFLWEPNGFVLLASSSTGETWRVPPPTKAHSTADRETPDPPSASSDDAAAELADQLALQIIKQEPSATSLAMTSSWPAFQYFENGLEEWRKAEAGSYEALSLAIEDFRKATEEDSSFALAFYRLGFALRSDGQPARAVEAFNSGLKEQPNFVPSYIALADTEYNFDRFHFQPPAALAPFEPSSSEAASERVQRAHSLWQQVLLFPSALVSPPDRASAYYGLCSVALQAKQYRPAYFYCKRAEQSYAKSSPSLQENLQVKQTQAAVLNTTGVVLARRAGHFVPDLQGHFVTDANREWRCSSSDIASVEQGSQSLKLKYQHWVSPYEHPALHYYQKALALTPDDPVIRCNASSASLALGDAAPMKRVNDVAAAHQVLGSAFRNSARTWLSRGDQQQAAAYFRLAMGEYGQAVQRIPNDINAINEYAYTFWTWRDNLPDAKPPLGPGSDIAQAAEAWARYAVRLVTDKIPAESQLTYQSTLAEVLLGQARPHEAIEILRAKRIPLNAVNDEIRWDLAQAYICAAFNDSWFGIPASEASYFKSEAGKLLSEIQSNEEKRETRTFGGSLLDVAPIQPVCIRRPGTAVPGVELEVNPGQPRYRLRDEQGLAQPRYKTSQPCGRLGVFVDAYDNEGQPIEPGKLNLHFWGGGLNTKVVVGKTTAGARYPMLLTYNPTATHLYYFAQLERLLEDQTWTPVSVVYPIDTFADCTRNEIDLVFVPEAQPK